MLDVKVSTRGSGKSLDVSQFISSSGNVLEGCRFHVNSPVESADAWLVLEDLDDDDRICDVPSESVVFLSAETSWPLDFYEANPAAVNFLDQFAWIYSPHAIYRSNVTSDLPFLPWMVNANHGESIAQAHERDVTYLRGLVPVDKPRELSVICSNQTLTVGHRMRFRFVEKLKEHFQGRLDWFGNGINPIPEKWAGLAPYKYSIAIENHMAHNVITEKLWDPLLTWTMPIYAGAPNAGAYIPEDSFVTIDIRDLNGSIAAIEAALESDLYSAALPALGAARERVLGPLNLYSRLAAVAHRHAGAGPVERIQLDPMAEVTDTGDRSLTRALGEQINKVGDLLVKRSLR